MTEAYFDSRYSRRNALRLMVAGAAGLAAPGLLGTPAFAQKAPAKPSGRIVVGLGQEPTVFNPLMAHIEVDDGVHFSVFDALFRIDPKGEIQPNLAVEVPSQKNGGISEDGLKWRLRLRDDVRWHDGTPFSAEDVKFTIELINNPNFRSRRRPAMRSCATSRWSRPPRSRGEWRRPTRPICRS